MLRPCFTAAFVALCLLFAPASYAFLDPPYLTPEHPAVGEVIAVNIYGGECDAIIGSNGWPHISQQGSSIHIVLWSASYSDPILCNLGIGTATQPVGTYPAGSYTLQVDREYFGDFGGILTETLGVIPFTVSGSSTQAAALPSLHGWGLGVLGFALFVIALSTMRRRLCASRAVSRAQSV